MKCVIIIAAFFVCCQASSQEAKDLGKKLDASLEKCAKINNVTSDQAKKIGKLSLPLEKNVQCAIACVAKELEIMNSGDNSLDRAKIASLTKIVLDDLKGTHQEKLVQKGVEIAEICLKSHTANNDECVSANNFAECFIENSKKNGLLDSPKQ